MQISLQSHGGEKRTIGPRRRAAVVACLVLFLAPAGAGQAAPDAEPQVLIEQGYFSEAAARSRQLLTALRIEDEAAELRRAELMGALAEALRRSGHRDDPEVLELARSALEIDTRLLGEEHPRVAHGLHQLGLLHSGRREIPEARRCLERALALREKLLGPTDPAVAMTLIMLAYLEGFRAGDRALAQRHLARAGAIQDAALPDDHPDVAWRLMALGEFAQYQEDLATARPLYARALEIRLQRLRPDHPYTGDSHHNLGTVLMAAGEFLDARRHLERGMEIRIEMLGAEHPLVAEGRIVLANLRRRLEDNEGAREMYEDALATLIAHHGEDSMEVAWCLDELADVLHKLERCEAAQARYARALATRQACGTEPSNHAAEVHNRYGACLQMSGDLDAAQAQYEQARRIASESPLALELAAEPSSLVWRIEANQAALRHERGDPRGARAMLLRLLATHQGSAESSVREALWCLLNLAQAELDLGNDEAALSRALCAERIAREELRAVSQGAEQALALHFQTGYELREALDLALTSALHGEGDRAERLARAFDAVIRGRALVLDEVVARRRAAARSDDPHIAELRATWQRACRELSELAVREAGAGASEASEARRRAATEAKRDAERALVEASAAFRRELDRRRIGLAEVRGALPPGDALVAYVRYRDFAAECRDAYAALVLFRDELLGFPLGEAEGIDALVAGWSRQLAMGSGAVGPASTAEESLRRTGTALRERVLDPFIARLTGAERIFVVPDGALHLVSFGAFPLGEDRYLVEAGSIVHYLSAERGLAELQEPATLGEGLLAIGGPDFGGRPSELRQATPDGGDATALPSFEALPQASLEAQEVERLYRIGEGELKRPASTTVVLRGAEATEAAFKTQAKGKRILHLATHGYFLEAKRRAPAEGQRGISPWAHAAPAQSDPVSEPDASPLLRSGLALAGANRRGEARGGEDGILTAEEIATLDLEGVAWAVLSACDTGRGSVRVAEGVFGLRRAFELAGARTVVMSLGPVDDRAARDWMARLCAAKWLQGNDTAAAVHGACLAVLAERRAAKESTHPFYWAPFVATGDWR